MIIPGHNKPYRYHEWRTSLRTNRSEWRQRPSNVISWCPIKRGYHINTHTHTHSCAHRRQAHTHAHSRTHTRIPIRTHSYTLARSPIPIRTQVFGVLRARTHRPTVHTHAHTFTDAQIGFWAAYVLCAASFSSYYLCKWVRCPGVTVNDNSASLTTYHNVFFLLTVHVDLPTGCCGYYVIRQCCRRWPVKPRDGQGTDIWRRPEVHKSVVHRRGSLRNGRVSTSRQY